MRIAIIGTGYVGLVAGTCFADSGNDVTCVDIDERKIRMLQAGEVPIYEPGLEELIKKNVREKRLFFTRDLTEAVTNAQVVFIAVGTPEGESGDADLQYVLAAAEQIGKAMKQYTVVVDKSTVPVGTADKVREAIRKVTDIEFDVVSNPEFLKEGAALDDFLKPDRVVIGVDSERARKVMADLYSPFVRTENPVLFMDTRSAELTKYAANAMLATRISFMNDIAALCEKVGADVDFVRKGLGSDKRIGYPFLFPGVGYGGSCFPKDVKALVATARDYGLELDLLRAVERTNERQKKLLVTKAAKHYGSLEGRKFGVWGLAFKPKTDDMREAPSIEVIEGLIGKGAQVIAHDPVSPHTAKRVFGDRIRYASVPYEALEGVDGLFVVTEWNEFRHPDFERMKTLMKSPVVFDGRNVYDPARMRELGFTYYGIGRR
ncbi:UDP-glucose 6-dehydrogenase [Myxococcus xanthus DK 1622]|uniref:UDP-glucose 6-dehydrogenase n=1 Tax=Myxococcus xanthus (strain DK1622) TaxID=246197 RepID=Q1DDG4_MYXXD|nr:MULTISPECIES: UDP-glucose/GDP-mannose dehydrogenase family protein [Myxococcus]ABF88466.1 UDP-glucose 6-dehydrogenase [Myxococcus xanthus DK 1622]NOJ52193.1 UDP-glucose/GDP-mannose dehydrogenase family protein [Myxococcus xanthus]QPM80700.1 UDP-glucose/GDP-mannose dehydrogenase family protein [Myxococcus xanthus]QVW69761.1 UDP-glucose/GDP-mannose dehydrogenase family protein [Myxococcus xanthus DZ2]QZZ48572.1 UDP-glucose 6-dehydrogenase TuaD [Myxococcus xanthus]